MVKYFISISLLLIISSNISKIVDSFLYFFSQFINIYISFIHSISTFWGSKDKHITCKPFHWWSSHQRRSQIGKFGSPSSGSGRLSAWAHGPLPRPYWEW